MRVRIALCLWVMAASAVAAESDWQESVLQPATLEKVYKASGVYQRCIGEQLSGQVDSRQDPRAVTDAILKTCETRLQPMRDAFTAEKVPAEIADRYLRKTRTQAARGLIREIMGMQAMRQAAPN